MIKDLDSYGIYPLTITLDRYEGTYSGGKILAINSDEFPQGVSSGDLECDEFWKDYKNIITIGVGDTVHDAIMDLKRKMEL